MELLQSGEILAQRYRILDILGEGGSSITYLAQTPDGEQVAIKALSLHRMTDWKMLSLFEREANVLAQLNFPGIPKYIEYFHTDTDTDRSFYIAQQLAPGKSLAALVADGYRTSEDEVKLIAAKILEILVYLHAQQPPVIHRDIKPENIILNIDGRQQPQIFLVDFGAVTNAYYTTFMRGSTVVGTYGYMAPEQFRGQAVPATDLYGLGATLLFLLTHRSPADLPSDELKIDFRTRVEISEAFADWLEKMLEPDSNERFTSAQSALDELNNLHTSTNSQNKHSRKNTTFKIAAVGAAIFTISLANYYKWALLDVLGFAPPALFDTKRKITQQAFDNCAMKLAPLGSIILTSRANIGILALAGVELCTNQNCKTLVSNSQDINTNYFYYQLLARKQELVALAKRVTFKELETSDLQNFELWLPPISIQNKIAEYLDCETAKLDALIVAKNKFIELLIERRHVITYTVNNDTKAYLEFRSKHNNLTSISIANIKQLHVEGITSKLDELINTTYSTIKLLYERRTALIEAAISGHLHAIM